MHSTEPRASSSEKVLTYLVWLAALVACSYLCYLLRNFTSSLLLYLPAALSIAMVHWYGYRAIPIIYLNAIITLFIWEFPDSFSKLLVVATHEPVVAFASYFLTSRLNIRGKQFESAGSFVLFAIFGVAVPIGLNSFYTFFYSFVDGDLEKVLLLWLSDFITVYSLCLPLLFNFSPAPGGLWFVRNHQDHPSVAVKNELRLFLGAFVVCSFLVPFHQYWFIYGIAGVMVGLRHGFSAVLLINVGIFFVNYILPLIESSTALATTAGSTQLINVHLGNATMLFVSTVVGKVVTDLRKTEISLIRQQAELVKTNEQLQQTNRELDRFVYSVSHDLSAPLKSIQGLVHLSKKDRSPEALDSYLGMMEKSANRLQNFIGEVLDYARTSRTEVQYQDISLPKILAESYEKLGVDDQQLAGISTSLTQEQFRTDPTLLKIIVSNLLSNALKFRRRYETGSTSVHIRSWTNGKSVCLSISDNGEGIQEEHLPRIFEMFYRATENAPGSGLGLYIAREAAAKLGGKIEVVSRYGEGSTFTVTLPNAISD